ncbi:MAG: 50S ribosomal protein L23 [Candidatus Diapherotrites archaeon CG09_land_8_20_14_0_10_32_12]|nr:MAG: 50S ribosomal protein L23 [Candidatus Diapherotrites archaeon CG09_land_8_20_14_0_10_32_12]
MDAKINYPVISEKAVNMIETQNKITFIVTKDATKPEVKKAVEDRYKVKVEKVNMLRDMNGRKKAIVKLTKEFKASELASKIGMI